ncbi:PP2C family serine/threonine-protein phosphatase [Sorangium sp. So ce1128]
MAAGASVTGRLHEKSGVPCQDAVAISAPGKITVIALADGAGSARHADAGAQLAVAETVKHVSERFDALWDMDVDRARAEIVDVIVARLGAEARTRHASLADFGSTLLFVAVDRERFLAGHIGDGVIACERDGQSEILSRPQRGEHANETVFLTSGQAQALMFVVRGSLDGRSSFALMSDGSAESLYTKRDGSLAAALRSIWTWLDKRAPREVEEALEINLRELFRERTGDDCSLAVLRLVRVPAPQIAELAPIFQQALLDCRSPRSLKTRLSVLQAMLDSDTDAAVALSRKASVSVTTVRRHLPTLRALMCRRSSETT